MGPRWMERVTGPLDDKRRYREYKDRVQRLPDSHRAAVEALERYLTYAGAITTGDTTVSMLDDLAELFEQSAADGIPVRAVVGTDPVDFAEAFLANYAQDQWINKERDRLTTAIDLAAGDDGGAR